MYKRHHPPSSQELAQYFSRKESQQLCTLPITPHLFEEQLNIITLPQIPKAEKVTREKLLAAPPSCWHSLAFQVRHFPMDFHTCCMGRARDFPSCSCTCSVQDPAATPARAPCCNSQDLESNIQQILPGPVLSPIPCPPLSL